MDKPTTPISVPRFRRKVIVLSILALFLLPIAARAALFAYEGGPMSWREANWSSTGTLPKAAADFPEARVLIMSGRTGGWKGVFSVHSWVVFKPENGKSWRRYDVVGWGDPVRTNLRDPDGRWYGNLPQVVLDLRGAAEAEAIPKIEAAVKSYQYANAGDYRIWPGPNSNTFTATLLRAIPEAEAALPANAVGRDFRPWPYVGLTDSRTGIEASLWGMLGVKIGWVEGVEVNFLGLVAGLDLRHPGIKLPGFGRIGLPHETALAAPAR